MSMWTELRDGKVGGEQVQGRGAKMTNNTDEGGGRVERGDGKIQING